MYGKQSVEITTFNVHWVTWLMTPPPDLIFPNVNQERYQEKGIK